MRPVFFLCAVMLSLFLGFAFLLVAAVYAAAGFGGGSTYNALLVLAGVDYRSIPIIALTCNIIVVTGGIYHYSRGGHFSWRDLAPFAILSIPMAWLGGRIPVSEPVFVGLLGLTLLLTAAFLLTKRLRQPGALSVVPRRNWQWGIPAGAGIGLVSGMVGVGGGIFLAPLLYLMRQGSPRRIAALASGFILLNSLAGLAGQLMKHGGSGSITLWSENWLLFIAVLVGGQLGSRVGAMHLPEAWVRSLTGVLVLYVSLRLLLRWANLVFG